MTSAVVADLERQRDDAIARVEQAGVKARQLRADALHWRDQVERLAAGLTEIRRLAADTCPEIADRAAVLLAEAMEPADV
jgi:hypothetical protein